MNRLQFSTDIKASREKVWDVLWNDSSYKEWTSVFSSGSHAETDWNEGSKVLFLSGEREGMYSRIAKKIPNEYMSFKHLGVVKEGKELPQDDETKRWSGASEDYKLIQKNNATELTVEMDVTEDFEDYFRQTFPKALEKVKELAEK